MVENDPINLADALGPNEIYRAIYQGVYDAMWKLMTNATDMPCADFYEAVTKGVAQAVKDKD